MKLRLLTSACAAALLAQILLAPLPAAHAQTRRCDKPPADCLNPTDEKPEAATVPPAAAEVSGEPAANVPAPEPAPLPATAPPLVTPNAMPPDAVLPALPLPVPTPFDTKAVRLADDDSYEDAYRVLSVENSCSRFFGGPALAVEVLNGLALRLRRKNLGDELAIRQSGDYTNFHNMRTGGSYRLFEEASLNTSGPFSRRAETYGRQSERAIGRFPARSRQGRALVLLHELGHLIRKGRAWLLPNDGHDAALSASNTRAVEGHCLGQLVALGE